RHASVFSPPALDRLDRLIRLDDPDALAARYIAAHGSEAYGRAFTKILADPLTAHLRMTPQEQLAVQEAVAADAARTMAVGTGSAGQFGTPIQTDPTISLVGSGALCPIRQYCTVRPCISDTLRLVSSDGTTAAYAAELTEASDNSPTLAQPIVDTAKGQAFVPY